MMVIKYDCHKQVWEQGQPPLSEDGASWWRVEVMKVLSGRGQKCLSSSGQLVIMLYRWI